MKFKDCSRCGGDCFAEDSFEGRELVCLQCGRRVPEVLSNRSGVNWVPGAGGAGN
jgi:DNA-directed RNA polymerase subunit RPC12/RpoP